MSELKWNWVYYPYLDAPNEQEESALKAGYIKVVDKSEADKVIAEKDKEIEQLQAMLEERNKQVGELKEERRWRKASEEKPECDGDYLVMARYPDDDEPHIEICFFDSGCEDFGHYERRYAGSGDSFGGFDGEEWITHNVSYWMPLPKALEGK